MAAAASSEGRRSEKADGAQRDEGGAAQADADQQRPHPRDHDDLPPLGAPHGRVRRRLLA